MPKRTLFVLLVVTVLISIFVTPAPAIRECTKYNEELYYLRVSGNVEAAHKLFKSGVACHNGDEQKDIRQDYKKAIIIAAKSFEQDPATEIATYYAANAKTIEMMIEDPQFKDPAASYYYAKTELLWRDFMACQTWQDVITHTDIAHASSIQIAWVDEAQTHISTDCQN